MTEDATTALAAKEAEILALDNDITATKEGIAWLEARDAGRQRGPRRARACSSPRGAKLADAHHARDGRSGVPGRARAAGRWRDARARHR